jgi:glycosyltransferase involved in cell wall biosynthesis
MRVLIINTNESSGGAAKAANRLHKGLRKIGVESFMLVRYKQSDDPYVIAIANNRFWRFFESCRMYLNALPKLLYLKRDKVTFSLNWVPNPWLFYYIHKLKPDIINLHWVNAGFISIPQIGKICNLGMPVYWTLHDQWPLTGGCHYAGSCIKYKTLGCGACPQLKSQFSKDITYLTQYNKKLSYKNINFIATTKWMYDLAMDSELANKNVNLIPLGLEMETFKELNQDKCRKKFQLPLNKKIILFGADNIDDERKGIKYLLQALELIRDNKNIILATFGSKEQKIDTNIPIFNIGYLNGIDKMAELYNCCDVFVGPSLEEAFGQTFLEAMACGKLVIGFDKGGQVDLIRHQKNGYLAKYKDSQDLANGILWCLKNNKNGELSKFAREFAVKNFALELQAQRYKDLFQQN